MPNPKDYFYFTKQERRGVAVLTILILVIAFLPNIASLFSGKDNSQFDYKTRFDDLQSSGQPISDQNIRSEWISKDEISENSTTKVQKEYARQPVEKDKTFEESEKKQEQEFQKIVIQINSASAEEFQKLYGIGEVLSTRIVKFREALGGFVSVSQISETYGLEMEVFQDIQEQLVLEPQGVYQHDLNLESVDELANHPYISEHLAQQMVNFREKVKQFESDEDVKKLYFMDDELFKKLRPYIKY